MKFPKFSTGLIIGTAVGLVVWYWQKSTSAEDGALAVLDKLAAAEANVRELKGQLRLAEEQRAGSDRPEVLSGLSDLWGLKAAPAETDAAEVEIDEVDFDDSADNEIAEDDLKVISGIGPAYERRLKDAGIHTYADLTRQTPEELRTVTGLKSWQATDPAEWIAEAQALSEA